MNAVSAALQRLSFLLQTLYDRNLFEDSRRKTVRALNWNTGTLIFFRKTPALIVTLLQAHVILFYQRLSQLRQKTAITRAKKDNHQPLSQINNRCAIIYTDKNNEISWYKVKTIFEQIQKKATLPRKVVTLASHKMSIRIPHFSQHTFLHSQTLFSLYSTTFVLSHNQIKLTNNHFVQKTWLLWVCVIVVWVQWSLLKNGRWEGLKRHDWGAKISFCWIGIF